MKDVATEARELLEGQKISAYLLADDVQHIVRGLLERIGELEQERDARGKAERAHDVAAMNGDIFKSLAKQCERERDAALERVRVLERVAKDMLESTEWTVTGLVQAADVELVLAGLPPYDLDELRRQYEAKNEAPNV